MNLLQVLSAGGQAIGQGANNALRTIGAGGQAVGQEVRSIPHQAGSLLKQLILGPGGIAHNATSPAQAAGITQPTTPDPIANSLYPAHLPGDYRIPPYNSVPFQYSDSGAPVMMPMFSSQDIQLAPSLAHLSQADRSLVANSLYNEKYIDPQISYFISRDIAAGKPTGNQWLDTGSIQSLRDVVSGKTKIPLGGLSSGLLYTLETASGKDQRNPILQAALEAATKPQYQDRYNKLGY